MVNLETKISTKIEQEILVKNLETYKILRKNKKQTRKDGEAKLNKIVEDNFNLMRSDLNKETKLRVEMNQALEVINI